MEKEKEWKVFVPTTSGKCSEKFYPWMSKQTKMKCRMTKEICNEENCPLKRQRKNVMLGR